MSAPKPTSQLTLFAAAVVGSAALAGPSPYETIVATCLDLPRPEERNIINSRGDQQQLKANESFGYDYGYRQRDRVKVYLPVSKGENDGDLRPVDVERVTNRREHFRGDSVSSVKNLAETFVRVNHYFACPDSTK